MSALPTRHRSPGSERQRFLAESVVTLTRRLVGMALRQSWAEIPAVLQERRGLLADLERTARQGSHEASCIAALRGAVAESERTLGQIQQAATI